MAYLWFYYSTLGKGCPDWAGWEHVIPISYFKVSQIVCVCVVQVCACHSCTAQTYTYTLHTHMQCDTQCMVGRDSFILLRIYPFCQYFYKKISFNLVTVTGTNKS